MQQIFVKYKQMIQQWKGSIDFMLNDKRPTDFTNLFSPNNLKKDDSIILE